MVQGYIEWDSKKKSAVEGIVYGGYCTVICGIYGTTTTTMMMMMQAKQTVLCVDSYRAYMLVHCRYFCGSLDKMIDDKQI
jgi:hypothetical protein